MPLKHFVREALKDARRFGLTFPIRSSLRSAGRNRYQVRLPGGPDITVRKGALDFDMFRQVFRDGSYMLPPAHAARVRAAYDSLLAQGRTPLILDLGANIGAGALWFAAQYPDARIIAVEPDAANADLLRENTRQLPAIEVVEAAVGSTGGSVVLSNPAGYPCSVQTQRGDAENAVPLVTIRELVERAGPDAALFIVKVDIEGFEDDLFSRNTEWLDEAAVVIIEPHDWIMPGRRTSRSFQAQMGQHDYELLLSGENLIYVR